MILRTRVLALLAAAVLALAMIAGPGIAWDSDRDTAETNSSTAEISLVDCVVESSKDISYVAFLDDGEELDKFNVNAPTYDLSGYDRIDDVTDVRVKSGETVETFAVDCPVEDDDATDPNGDDDGDDTTDDDADDDDDTTDDDDTDDHGDDDVTQPDSDDSHNDNAGTNSQAVITLSGCTVHSSKDISYVAFLDGGEQLDKDETVGSQSYNLRSFGDIDEVDSVRVKAGTTVATFNVNCGTQSEDDTTDEHGDDHDANDDDAMDDDADHGDDDADTDEHGDDDANEDDVTDDDVTRDEDTDDDDADDDADTDDEWDARHDGRHEHKDHEEIQ